MAEIIISRKVGDSIQCGCPPCEEIFQGMTAIIAVFISCECVAFPDDMPPTSLKIDHVTGITGAFSPVGVGGNSIGEAYIQGYAGDDLTCSSPIGDPQLNPVSLLITCLGPILFPEIVIAGFGSIFKSATGGRVGDIITNDLACGDPIELPLGIVGSVQLFLP